MNYVTVISISTLSAIQPRNYAERKQPFVRVLDLISLVVSIYRSRRHYLQPYPNLIMKYSLFQMLEADDGTLPTDHLKGWTHTCESE